jgi:5'-methylthioadenosine phosphorylase
MTAPRPSGSRLCVIHGNSLPEGADPIEGRRFELEIGGTRVEGTDGGDIVGIARHGFDRNVPAHLVDHRANITAGCELGCDRVLALASVGTLREDLPVGTLICPDDFYAPQVAPSFYSDARGHSVPGFDDEWRVAVISTWDALTETELENGGVYAQTRGPRFETPAEVRALGEVADVVGMTIAAESILAREATLAYAAVCTIDNWGNGVLDRQLTVEEYRRSRDQTAAVLVEGLRHVLPALAKETPGS